MGNSTPQGSLGRFAERIADAAWAHHEISQFAESDPQDKAAAARICRALAARESSDPLGLLSEMVDAELDPGALSEAEVLLLEDMAFCYAPGMVPFLSDRTCRFLGRVLARKTKGEGADADRTT